MDKFPISKTAYADMEAEIKKLKTEDRPAVIKAIAEAREHGDLSENAEYHAAREKQSFIEGRILDLEDKFARAEVIDIKQMSGEIIKFGAIVSLMDEETEEKITYQIVGEYEADIKARKLSLSAPIARALIGKKKGDSVIAKTPGGEKFFEITEVKYG